MLNRIGVLGGMGPGATLHFLKLLHKTLSAASRPVSDQEYPDMTVLYESTIPDRSAAIKEDPTEAKQRINRAIASLILSGCDPVVIPCISAHALVEQRWFDAGVIDFRNCVSDHFESIYTDQIAILATDGAISSELFEPLLTHFDLIYPSDSHQKKIMSIIYGRHGLKTFDTDPVYCKNEMESIFKEFRSHGIDNFLIGCTELETFISEQFTSGNFILPMELMCEEIVARVRSEILNK